MNMKRLKIKDSQRIQVRKNVITQGFSFSYWEFREVLKPTDNLTAWDVYFQEGMDLVMICFWGFLGFVCSLGFFYCLGYHEEERTRRVCNCFLHSGF
jgi:hypothetical protein